MGFLLGKALVMEGWRGESEPAREAGLLGGALRTKAGVWGPGAGEVPFEWWLSDSGCMTSPGRLYPEFQAPARLLTLQVWNGAALEGPLQGPLPLLVKATCLFWK